MLRVTLVELLLFLAPFAAFAAYLAIAHGLRDSEAIKNAMPKGKLVLAGLVLMVIGFGLLATFDQAGTEGTYHPATFEDGKIKPGRIE